MSSRDVSTRRSRRTPTTPSRYGKDFILESMTIIKKEPKDTSAADSPRKSPRGSNTSDHGDYSKKGNKQASQRQTKEIVTRTTRSGSKRVANSEELPADDGIGGKKKKTVSRVIETKKMAAGAKKTEQSVTYKITVQGGDGVAISYRPQEEDATTPTLDNVSISGNTEHLLSAIMQHATSHPSSSSHPKDQESEETSRKSPAAHPSPEKISTSPKAGSSDGIGQPVSTKSMSSLFKALKQALGTDKPTSGESGSKDTPVSVTDRDVQPSLGKSHTTKVNSNDESGTKDTPKNVTVRTEFSTSGKCPTSEGTKSKDSSVAASPKATTPVKRVQVNIIRSNQMRHVGLLEEQSQKTDTDTHNSVQVVSSTRTRSTSSNEASKPTSITTDMLGNIKVKGRTTGTQTTQDDMHMLLHVNKNLTINRAHNVLTVSSATISKPIRAANNSKLKKHCQTTSKFSDINFVILEAIGNDSEIVNEHSLSYAGEETCDVDKKIQWMLFGRDLESAMMGNRGGIPSNVIDKDDTEGNSKPENAKIAVESWSLALTVLNPNV